MATTATAKAAAAAARSAITTAVLASDGPAPFSGPVIITRWLPATNTRGARIVAEHKRDRQTTWRKYWAPSRLLTDEQNHHAAALALMADWPLIPYGPGGFVLAGRGGDAVSYHWLCVNADQLAALR